MFYGERKGLHVALWLTLLVSLVFKVRLELKEIVSVRSVLWHRFPLSKWNCREVAQEWGERRVTCVGIFINVFAIWKLVWGRDNIGLVSRIYPYFEFFFVFQFRGQSFARKDFFSKLMSKVEMWWSGFGSIGGGIFSLWDTGPSP